METHIDRGDGVVFVGTGDVVITVWTAAATVERGRFVTAAFARRLTALDGDVIYLQLIAPTSTPPDAETRAAAVEMLRRLGPRIRCLVTVPLGTSMWAILVRMVVRGLALLSGPATVAVDSVDAAVAEIERLKTPLTPPADELRALLASLMSAAPEARRQRAT